MTDAALARIHAVLGTAYPERPPVDTVLAEILRALAASAEPDDAVLAREVERVFAAPAFPPRNACSFCAMAQGEVEILDGPAASICRACVTLAREIIEEAPPG